MCTSKTFSAALQLSDCLTHWFKTSANLLNGLRWSATVEIRNEFFFSYPSFRTNFFFLGCPQLRSHCRGWNVAQDKWNTTVWRSKEERSRLLEEGDGSGGIFMAPRQVERRTERQHRADVRVKDSRRRNEGWNNERCEALGQRGLKDVLKTAGQRCVVFSLSLYLCQCELWRSEVLEVTFKARMKHMSDKRSYTCTVYNNNNTIISYSYYWCVSKGNGIGHIFLISLILYHELVWNVYISARLWVGYWIDI